MEQLIRKLIQDFEEGAIGRRQLIGLLVATASGASFTPQQAAAQSSATPLKAIGINHISYQVADYAKTRDFYSTLFGMPVSEDDGKHCVLGLGETHITLRSAKTNTPLVDHIAYNIENWNKDAVLAELTRRKLDPKSEGPNSFQLKDPDGYHVQLSPKS